MNVTPNYQLMPLHVYKKADNRQAQANPSFGIKQKVIIDKGVQKWAMYVLGTLPVAGLPYMGTYKGQEVDKKPSDIPLAFDSVKGFENFLSNNGWDKYPEEKEILLNAYRINPRGMSVHLDDSCQRPEYDEGDFSKKALETYEKYPEASKYLLSLQTDDGKNKFNGTEISILAPVCDKYGDDFKNMLNDKIIKFRGTSESNTRAGKPKATIIPNIIDAYKENPELVRSGLRAISAKEEVKADLINAGVKNPNAFYKFLECPNWKSRVSEAEEFEDGENTASKLIEKSLISLRDADKTPLVEFLARNNGYNRQLEIKTLFKVVDYIDSDNAESASNFINREPKGYTGYAYSELEILDILKASQKTPEVLETLSKAYIVGIGKMDIAEITDFCRNNKDKIIAISDKCANKLSLKEIKDIIDIIENTKNE